MKTLYIVILAILLCPIVNAEPPAKIDGFAGIPFGSTPDQVKAAMDSRGAVFEPKFSTAEHLAFKGASFSDEPAGGWNFYFSDDKLFRALVSINPPSGDHLDTYYRIKKLISDKYGKPFQETKLEVEPDKVYELVRSGQAALKASWREASPGNHSISCNVDRYSDSEVCIQIIYQDDAIDAQVSSKYSTWGATGRRNSLSFAKDLPRLTGRYGSDQDYIEFEFHAAGELRRETAKDGGISGTYKINGSEVTIYWPTEEVYKLKLSDNALIDSYGFVWQKMTDVPISAKQGATTSLGNVALSVDISNSTQNGKTVVMLNAKLTNGSPNTISWLKENDAAELHIQIVNAEGISPSLTKEGEIQCAPFPGLFVRAHELEAGKTAEWTINLTELFNLVPDKYILSVMMSISSPSCILSVSGLKFEIRQDVPYNMELPGDPHADHENITAQYEPLNLRATKRETNADSGIKTEGAETIIESLVFQNTPIKEVLTQISNLAHLNIIYLPGKSERPDSLFTLKLKDIPARQALRYISSLTDLKLTFEADGAHLGPGPATDKGSGGTDPYAPDLKSPYKKFLGKPVAITMKPITAEIVGLIPRGMVTYKGQKKIYTGLLVGIGTEMLTLRSLTAVEKTTKVGDSDLFSVTEAGVARDQIDSIRLRYK
jgi:hypothetical protein